MKNCCLKRSRRFSRAELKAEWDYPGDKLIFQKREGDTFYFNHTELLGGKETMVTYKIHS